MNLILFHRPLQQIQPHKLYKKSNEWAMLLDYIFMIQMPLLDFNVDLRSLERSLSHKCIVGLLRKMNHYTEAAQNTRGKRKRDIAKVLQKGGVIYAEQVR